MNVAGEREQRNRQGYDFGVQGVQWSQVSPQFVPWGHTATPLVTFSTRESPLGSGMFPTHTLVAHCKRKADLDIQLSPSAAKQHITEERMAAHMSRLHISSETTPDTSPEETVCTREQRLYVCEEMRRLQTESILPSSLLGRLERPCMAVMLWQPPPKIPELLLPAPAARCGRRPLLVPEEDADNNNSSALDLNNMDMDT